MKVIFHEVHSLEEKIGILGKICEDHIEKKIFLHLIIDEPKLLLYLDDLLWSYKKESFLPHKLAQEAGRSLITLGKFQSSIASCREFMNFSNEAFLDKVEATVYEFDDQTLPIKRQLTQKKYHTYKTHQAQIIAY